MTARERKTSREARKTARKIEKRQAAWGTDYGYAEHGQGWRS